MEIIDLYDKFRNKTNKTQPRKQPLEDQTFRSALHVCIFDSKGRMLLQQRSAKKGTFAHMWDISLGGGVQAGENVCQAAERELGEELGIDADFSNLRPAFTINFDGGFDDFFILQKDVKLEDLKFRDHEVTNAQYATKKQVLQLLKSGNFVPYKESIIKLIYEMRKSTGSFV